MKLFIYLLLFYSILVFGTVNKVIYIPSTDNYKFLKPHLDVDNYFEPGEKGNVITNIGIGMGFLPFKWVKADLTADYLANLDQFLFGGAIIIPQSKFPSLSLGVYNISTSDENSGPVYYFLVSQKFRNFGRFLVGVYYGDKDKLRDGDGEADNKGLLISFDRYFNEISKKFYIGVDYFMGENMLSRFSFGVGWKFAKNVILKVTYHINLDQSSGDDQPNFLGFQVDIDS